MQPSFWQRVNGASRHQLPLVLTLILMLVSMVPTRLPDFMSISPMLTVISVYYWAVYRPDLMGYGSVFLIGVLEDLMAATPLGAGPVSLLVTQGIVMSQAKFFRGKSFAVTWWAFLLVAAAAAVAKWMAVALVQISVPSGAAVLATYGMTVAFYPVVAWIMARFQLAILREV